VYTAATVAMVSPATSQEYQCTIAVVVAAPEVLVDLVNRVTLQTMDKMAKVVELQDTAVAATAANLAVLAS
jgi:ethanolamine transporter EutH